MPPICRYRKSMLLVVALLCLCVVCVVRDGRANAAAPKLSFNRDIRPILSENCYRCHGPDAGARQAELRLDLEQAAVSDSGAIVPGRPDESELFRRITAHDPDERMPPADSGKSLTAEQIGWLKRWIEQGAQWESHWSFIPPTRPAVPKVDARNENLNPIDNFVEAQLQPRGLSASSPADRRTLIRRLSFDLLGLPPAPDEVDAFALDPSPDAYGKLVDRLLASPHFGERMAAHWLDLVRYADTVGYHGDQPVSVWPYRDYVIGAFNENLPYDRFTLEQLAGDLLPDATREQRIASGYNRLNMMTAEGGAQDKEYLAKYAADRVRTTSSVWMGATLGCAECHDHKFDPFTMTDFYSTAAFFADVEEKGFYGGAHATGDWGSKILVPWPEQEQELDRLDRRIAQLEQTLSTTTAELRKAQQDWEQVVGGKQLAWTTPAPLSAEATSGLVLQVLDDQSIFSTGRATGQATYSVDFAARLNGVTAIRLEALTDDRLPRKGPGRSGEGGFLLHDVSVTADGQPVELIEAYASTAAPGFEVANAIDGNDGTGWAVRSESGQPQYAVFQSPTPLYRQEGADTIRFKVNLHHPHENDELIGRFRISITSDEHAVAITSAQPAEVQEILAVAADRRNAEQAERLAAHFRSVTPALAGVRVELGTLKQTRQALVDRIPTTLVSKSVEPRMMRVLPRGNWMDESGPNVEPAVPGFLPQPEIDGRRLTRRDLARWLTSRKNPLAARAFVNRLWRMYFGRGLSKVLDDLGAQGEWPLHAELLDWLAVELIESGWDIKHIVRTIVTSAAYRRSSSADDGVIAADPYNRLLARQGRFRLDAEVVRDTALAVSGLIVKRIGGPSVRPYQPAGYYAQLNFPQRVYEPHGNENQFRRGVYTHWQRTFLHPMLLAFDAPSREECTAERPRSNTPLGALVLLNDPTFVESARVFAERIIIEGGGDFEQRIDWAYHRVLSRAPSDKERPLLKQLLDGQLARYGDDPAAARKLCQTGIAAVPDDLNQTELAAWTSVARAILNLHETITRY